jgi:hypothetical protein
MDANHLQTPDQAQGTIRPYIYKFLSELNENRILGDLEGIWGNFFEIYLYTSIAICIIPYLLEKVNPYRVIYKNILPFFYFFHVKFFNGN